MPLLSESDNALKRLVVAEILRRQSPAATTEDLVLVAAQSDERADAALRKLREPGKK